MVYQSFLSQIQSINILCFYLFSAVMRITLQLSAFSMPKEKVRHMLGTYSKGQVTPAILP